MITPGIAAAESRHNRADYAITEINSFHAPIVASRMQFREARHRQVFKAGDLPQICHQNWPLRKLCTAKFILAQNFFQPQSSSCVAMTCEHALMRK